MEEKVNKSTKGWVGNEEEGKGKGRKGRRMVRGRKKRIHDGKEEEKKGKWLPTVSQGILKCNVLQC